MLSKPIPQPKPEPRKRTKRRKARTETAVKRSVRAACVERDGYCRYAWDEGRLWMKCVGPSEWAHLRGHRRSQTRGQAPKRRHSTMHSLMLCKFHHGMEERGELRVFYVTPFGCDGPLRYEVKR